MNRAAILDSNYMHAVAIDDKELVGVISEVCGSARVNFTCAYIPGKREPSRLSICTSVSMVRAALSSDPALRTTVPAYSRPRRSFTSIEAF